MLIHAGNLQMNGFLGAVEGFFQRNGHRRFVIFAAPFAEVLKRPAAGRTGAKAAATKERLEEIAEVARVFRRIAAGGFRTSAEFILHFFPAGRWREILARV